MSSRLSQTLLNEKGHRVTLTWIQDGDLEQYKPCTQAYGIVFSAEGQILLIEENGTWKIPGGTPETGETPEQALRRELIEEADVTVGQVVLIGVQRVDYPNNPNATAGDVFYQYRYACLIDELLSPSLDPATGITNPRKFVPAMEVTEYVKWGEGGRAMFQAAIEAYKRQLRG